MKFQRNIFNTSWIWSIKLIEEIMSVHTQNILAIKNVHLMRNVQLQAPSALHLEHESQGVSLSSGMGRSHSRALVPVCN